MNASTGQLQEVPTLGSCSGLLLRRHDEFQQQQLAGESDAHRHYQNPREKEEGCFQRTR